MWPWVLLVLSTFHHKKMLAWWMLACSKVPLRCQLGDDGTTLHTLNQ